MSHPMSEFSERSRGRLLTAGIPHTPEPFAPENLPRIQYEMHGETTVDQRATEMLRKPTEAEIKQLGSDFRSDLNPHNYRTQTFYIPDSDAANGKIVEFQTDFQVWAVVIAIHADLGSNTPTNQIYIKPWNLIVATTGLQWVNFPTGQKLEFQFQDPTNPPTNGAGFHIWAYDRWIPEPGNKAQFF